MAVLWAPITRSPGVMSLIMADRGTPQWGTPEKPTENPYIKVIFGVAFSMLLVPRMEIAIPNPVPQSVTSPVASDSDVQSTTES